MNRFDISLPFVVAGRPITEYATHLLSPYIRSTYALYSTHTETSPRVADPLILRIDVGSCPPSPLPSIVYYHSYSWEEWRTLAAYSTRTSRAVFMWLAGSGLAVLIGVVVADIGPKVCLMWSLLLCMCHFM